jgi:hypothetical protein
MKYNVGTEHSLLFLDFRLTYPGWRQDIVRGDPIITSDHALTTHKVNNYRVAYVAEGAYVEGSTSESVASRKTACEKRKKADPSISPALDDIDFVQEAGSRQIGKITKEEYMDRLRIKSDLSPQSM